MNELPEPNKVFRLNNKDLTFFKLEPDETFINGVRVTFYMRFEKLWMYPPDMQESRFWRQLEKHAFHYAEQEHKEEVQRLENWYKQQIGE